MDVELGNFLELPAPINRTPVNRTPELLYASLRLSSQSRCIRVLDLDPLPTFCVNHTKQPLSGKLRIVSLQDCPRFMALSYVWGGYSTPKDVIHCNGRTAIEITINLRDALIALRKRYRRLTIWVDAICIDQQNVQEKSEQIPLMEEIYSWAERVIVWLGPGNDSSRKAIYWLRRAAYGLFFDEFVRVASLPISKQRFRYKFALMSSIMWCAIRDNLSVIGRFIPIWSCLRRHAWKPPNEDIEDLLHRDWFNRAWTFQEILLAWNITIICGESALDWGHLLGALDYCCNPAETGRWWYTSYESTDKGMGAMRELVESWMNISRPTHWNGQEIRCPLSSGDNSADSYQKIVASSFIRSRFVVLQIWYCTVSAFSNFIITFLLFLLLFAIPASSNRAVLKILTVVDAVVSVITGITAISAVLDRGNVTSHRRHFDLKFGSPNHDATAVHLSSIIRVIRQREVSEPKDRSYATHGVLRRLGMSLTPADYSKPLGQIYQDLFTDLVRWEPCLISLILEVEKDTLSDSPSWVPNWSALGTFLTRSEYIVNSDFQSRRKSTNCASIEGSRLTVAVVWKEIILQISNTFHPMDPELFLGNSDHFAASWDQVLFLAQWMSLFCRRNPTENRNINQRQDLDGEDVSYAGSETTLKKRTHDSEAAYRTIDADVNPHSFGWIGDSEDLHHNWYRLVDDVLPAFAAIGALPTWHFEAARDFIRNDPDAHLWQWEMGRDESTHRDAVKLMVQRINKLSAHRGRLFSTILGTPGYVSGSTDMKEGDLVAQLDGVYWPLVLRRTDTALDEYKVIGYAIIPDRSGFQTIGDSPDQLILV